ncbi:MAG: hypothetical protein ACRCX8_20050 [Sarcina sp.]
MNLNLHCFDEFIRFDNVFCYEFWLDVNDSDSYITIFIYDGEQRVFSKHSSTNTFKTVESTLVYLFFDIECKINNVNNWHPSYQNPYNARFGVISKLVVKEINLLNLLAEAVS